MTIGVIFKNCRSRHSGFYFEPGIKTQRKGRTGVSDKLCRSDSGIVLGAPIYL